MTPSQHIAAILSWLNSDAVLTPAERAEYAERLASYAKPASKQMTLYAPKEG
jgi:hypothetical protein